MPHAEAGAVPWQTRRNASAGERSLQGHSLAKWQPPPGGTGSFGIGITRAGRKSNTLEVATSHLRPGYLRKNGFPFSDGATLTEYFDVVREADGQEWLVITSIVEDPACLNEPWVTSTNLKREAATDRARWQPTPCTLR